MRSNARYWRRDAFSLVELVIVLLIMGILAAAAVPKFVDSLLFDRVESAARRVKADLELARQTARLTSRPYRFTVSFTAGSYICTIARDDGLPAELSNLDRPTEAYSINLSLAPYELQTVIANFNDLPYVTFDGYGTPKSGGTVELRARRNHLCTVRLDRDSGAVTIESGHSGGRTAELN